MSDPVEAPRLSPRAVSTQIVATVVFTFVAYLVVGMPLAVVPPFVHGVLHYSSVLAGLSVSVQYLATFVTRAPVGRMTDTVGPKQMVIFGLGCCAMSGVFTTLGGLFPGHPPVSLTLLLVGRLFLGAGESGVGTGAIGWAIGRVGPIHSARIISWNGVATFAGIAIGAPLGVTIQSLSGFWLIGLAMVAGALLVLPFAAAGPVTHLVRGVQIPMRNVFGRVLPHGIALALGSLGFGTIASFVTLFFASEHWGHAAIALSAFGGSFMLSRLLFVSSIARQGGLRVACIAFAGEACGLLLLGLAPQAVFAILGAALTGFTFAMVFPALGVEAFQRVPSSSRGAALGVFSVFLDVALGLTGPLAGLLVGAYGYPAIFVIAAVAAVAGAGITVALGARLAPPRA
jgi:MFS family permease